MPIVAATDVAESGGRRIVGVGIIWSRYVVGDIALMVSFLLLVIKKVRRLAGATSKGSCRQIKILSGYSTYFKL
jgi:hypothetical protein